MKKYSNLLFAILSGLLLGFSWPNTGSLTLLIFIAFVPLLLVENRAFKGGKKHRSRKVFWLAWLTFLIFNTITTWWIYYASAGGAILAIICNSLLMAIVFRLFHTAHKSLKKDWSYGIFVVLWLGFEYLHFNWDLSWPWLTLGNVFAVTPHWVQWYSVTGIFGGSLWVLVLNIFIFKIIRQYIDNKSVYKKSIIISALILLLPTAISYTIYYNYSPIGKKVKITIVQPNIDPYNEKFNIADTAQLREFLDLAKSKMTDSTAFVVGPETALPGGYFEDELEDQPVIKMLRNFLNHYPKCRLIMGLSSFKAYPKGTKHPASARKFSDGPGYYDAYNASMEIEKNEPIQIYHKSKLVLGVEKIPFQSVLKPLSKLAINLGGTVGSLGTQKHAADFIAKSKNMWYQGKIGTLICYESVYDAYCGEFVRRGAKILFIITNDGWWKNTPGYEQHFNYARLIAISYRRSIAQSANTGRSGFINQKGDSYKTSAWWVPCAIDGKMRENAKLTFYARHGDYLGVIAAFLAILSLFVGVLPLKKRL